MNTLDRAFELLKSNQPLEAEALAAEAAKQAEGAHGADSPEHASAQFDLARIQLAVGDLGRAAGSLRRAAEVSPRGDEARKARLTYLMNLGEVLQRLGRLEEAERALEESVAGRAEVYGEGSEGHAFGQEPLADVMFWRGRLEEAEELVEESAGVLWHARNGRVVAALALRAAIRAARYGDERPLLEHLDGLPPPLQQQLVEACLERAERDPPGPTLIVLQELRERMEDEEVLRPALPQVVAAKAEVARRGGDHPARLEAIGWLVEHFEASDPRQSLRARLGLSLARDEAGDEEGARQGYEEAVRRADALGDDAVRAQVRRNAGLFHARHEEGAGEAERLLAESLEIAERSGDPEQIGPALVAHGIFLQHQSRPEAARPALERALEVLPAAHPDAIYARNHLQALEHGGACGCGDMTGALAGALDQMVRPHLPEGLLGKITMDPASGFHGIQVQLTRPPTDEERDLLDRVLHQAVAELRGRIQRQGLS